MQFTDLNKFYALPNSPTRYLADNEIQWYIEPLVKCGEQPEPEPEDEGGDKGDDDDKGKRQW